MSLPAGWCSAATARVVPWLRPKRAPKFSAKAKRSHHHFSKLFSLVWKLVGMTGTAANEAEEFAKIYKLEVVKCRRIGKGAQRSFDRIYKTEMGNFRPSSEIKEHGPAGALGTISVENELLSELLSREGVPHEILNAKNHEKSRDVAKAGRPVTPPPIWPAAVWYYFSQRTKEAGGLLVIGTAARSALIISCAAAPAARVTRALRSFMFRWKMTWCVFSVRTALNGWWNF